MSISKIVPADHIPSNPTLSSLPPEETLQPDPIMRSPSRQFRFHHGRPVLPLRYSRNDRFHAHHCGRQCAARIVAPHDFPEPPSLVSTVNNPPNSPYPLLTFFQFFHNPNNVELILYLDLCDFPCLFA